MYNSEGWKGVHVGQGFWQVDAYTATETRSSKNTSKVCCTSKYAGFS